LFGIDKYCSHNNDNITTSQYLLVCPYNYMSVMSYRRRTGHRVTIRPTTLDRFLTGYNNNIYYYLPIYYYLRNLYTVPIQSNRLHAIDTHLYDVNTTSIDAAQCPSTTTTLNKHIINVKII